MAPSCLKPPRQPAPGVLSPSSRSFCDVSVPKLVQGGTTATVDRNLDSLDLDSRVETGVLPRSSTLNDVV